MSWQKTPQSLYLEYRQEHPTPCYISRVLGYSVADTAYLCLEWTNETVTLARVAGLAPHSALSLSNNFLPSCQEFRGAILGQCSPGYDFILAPEALYMQSFYDLTFTGFPRYPIEERYGAPTDFQHLLNQVADPCWLTPSKGISVELLHKALATNGLLRINEQK